MTGGLEWFPMEKLLNPEGYVYVHRDDWWIVKDDAVLIYRTADGAIAPQCNRNRQIVERHRTDGDIRQLPLAFIPIRISDYV